MRGPLFNIQQTTTAGKFYRTVSYVYSGAKGAVGSPSISVSAPSFTIGSASTPTITISAGNPNPFNGSSAWAYMKMDVTYPSGTRLLTQGTACSSYDYSQCRVYTLYENILIIYVAGTSTRYVYVQQTLNEISYARAADLFKYKLYLFSNNQLINTATQQYAFGSIGFSTTTLSSAYVSTLASYPMWRGSRAIITVDYNTPYGVLAGIQISPITSSDFTLIACSARYFDTTSRTYNLYYCKVSANAVEIIVSPPLAAGKILSL